MSDLISVKGIAGFGYHGVFEEERKTGQEFSVDVELLADLQNLGDDLNKTIDYSKIIEIEKDSSAKYEYCPKMDMLRLDRCLISSMRYPASYGFIPQTISDDGDPLDILVYNTVPIQTGTLVECRIIGGLKTYDNGVLDYKLLGIPLF